MLCKGGKGVKLFRFVIVIIIRVYYLFELSVVCM